MVAAADPTHPVAPGGSQGIQGRAVGSLGSLPRPEDPFPVSFLPSPLNCCFQLFKTLIIVALLSVRVSNRMLGYLFCFVFALNINK